jgi:hypothetical protein
MRHRCDCKCTIRVGRGDGNFTLERCDLHNMNSHATDKSKYLKYNQIILLTEAAVTAPNLSAAVIRRNMLMHESPTTTISVQHRHGVTRRVRPASKNMTAKQRGGVIMDDCFGALTDFCSSRKWPELGRKHNDPTDDYHLPLYYCVVIGHELLAERDIVRINLSFGVDAGKRAL